MGAAGGEPIGPYPPGVDTDDERSEYDKLRRRVMWTMPYGLYVMGSTDGAQRRNGMTVNWVTQVSFSPKLVGVGVERDALTHELVRAGECFSVCTIDRDDRAIVRKFTKPVEVDLAARTLNGFDYVERVTGAPILSRSVAYLDCRLVQEVPTGGHTFFIGEVVDAAFLAEETAEVLRMEDTRMSYGG
jgi:flavin reductase (DIM6/NTAB) family NADH-FMN oxidoreductase RutF